jgi:hypothetical protein
MNASTLVVLNQAGLVIGFIGAVLLAFSAKVGFLRKDGSVIITGLDSMESPITNDKLVRSSHWRYRIFTPIGWGMLALSFVLQFTATLG